MYKPILYLEGATGISGDMTVAALLALGASEEKLRAAIDSLHLHHVALQITPGLSYGLQGLHFKVELETVPHTTHHHPHTHRNLQDVCAIIDQGDLTPRARAIAHTIFQYVAEAESLAHGKPIEEVHFHEVGAIDSIIDAVAVGVCMDDLDLDACVITGLTEGSGTITCQHGELAVPVPAVLNIAQKAQIPLRPSALKTELVTPTGIAIAATLRTQSQLPSEYLVQKVGIGLGTRDIGQPNLLRALLLTPTQPENKIYVLETNMDDCTGETLGLAMEKLFAAGARDVHFLPCFMKKNRPGYLLRVITDTAHIAPLEALIFQQTTTIGIRRYPVERTCLKREPITLHLSEGDVIAKRCFNDTFQRIYPEYESVKQLAQQTGLDFITLMQKANEATQRL